MNTQQPYKLGHFKRGAAVTLGIITLEPFFAVVFMAIERELGRNGIWIATGIYLLTMAFLAYERIKNKGLNTYQNIQNPFTRRYVKSVTEAAIVGLVIYTSLFIMGMFV